MLQNARAYSHVTARLNQKCGLSISRLVKSWIVSRIA